MTLKEMGDQLKKILSKEGQDDLVAQIEKSLKRYRMSLDFEAIYSVIKGLSNLEESIQESGPFTAFVSKDLKDIPKNDLEITLSTLRNFIWKKCKAKKKYEEKLLQLYDRLFQETKNSRFRDKRVVPNREPQTNSLVSVGNTIETQVNVGKTIITTNYDHLIELYHRIKERNCIDGFRLSNDPGKSYLDFSIFSERIHDPWLIKLHGSLYQYKSENRILKTLEEPKKLTTKIKVKGNLMIYPTQEKSMLKFPYHNFYCLFKAQEWSKLIVLGYSFRDEPINTAIIENLINVKNCCLIVVTPHPKEAIKNLSKSILDEFENKIIPIKGKFGDAGVFSKIRIALKVNNLERYNVRLGEQEELKELFRLPKEKQ